MKLAAVIFDWAGTMVDFGSIAPVNAMRNAFLGEGVALTDGEIRNGMGLAKRDHVAMILDMPRIAGLWRSAHGAAAGVEDIDRIFRALEPLMKAAGAERADLIPGAVATVERLRAAGVRVGSTTGYTRTMMGPIEDKARLQGYAPEVVVCAGETRQGRPSPFMIWKALEAMGVWPATAVVKVDDAPAGIAEGRAAGCFTVGVAASGNAMGLDWEAYGALPAGERTSRLATARTELLAAGADRVIDTVADLPAALADAGLL